MATPGAHIQFVKSSESSYTVLVSGLPKEKSYALWQKWVDGKTQSLPVPDTNDLFGGKTQFHFRFFRGEPIDFALISSDQTARAYARLIPYPLEATAEGGCKLSVTLLSARGRAFEIVGEGFQPAEQITTISKSGSEILEDKAIASTDGRFVALILPGVVGKTGGWPSFRASSKTCNVTIQYEWGDAMKKVGE